MKNKTAVLAMLLAAALSACAAPMDPRQDYRVCGEPQRLADGSIKRRTDVIRAFRKLYPCPATGEATGACPGWAIDHSVPLVCGGCDSVSNMAWMPVVLKAGPGTLPKDRWEQKVYCSPQVTVQMPAKALPLSVALPEH